MRPSKHAAFGLQKQQRSNKILGLICLSAGAGWQAGGGGEGWGRGRRGEEWASVVPWKRVAR